MPSVPWDRHSGGWCVMSLKSFDDLVCPQCGSSDIDLSDRVGGAVFQCQECLYRFDPRPTGDDKPLCQLIGTDGNVFGIIARVSRCLKASGQPDRAQEWVRVATSAKFYDGVLRLVFEF